MHISKLFLLVACLVPFSVDAKVEIERVDYGPASPGQELKQLVKVENLTNRAVVIEDQIAAPWHKLRVTNLPLRVPANSSRSLVVEGKVERFIGLNNYRIDLSTSAGEDLRLSISIFVNSIFDSSMEALDFGTVPAGSSASKTAEFTAQDGSAFNLTSPNGDRGKVVHVAAPRGKNQLVVSVKRDAEWGEHEGWVSAETDNPAQPEVWLPYTATVQGDVVPNAYQLNSGLVRKGGVGQKVFFFLNRVTGDNLEIGRITHTGANVEYDVQDCVEAMASCQMIAVDIKDDNPFGQFRSELSVDLPQFRRKMTLVVYGVLLDPDTKISDLSDIAGNSAPDSASKVSSVLEGLTQESLPAVTMPEPKGRGPLLRWAVKNEGSTYGYLIFRSSSENGPWVRVSPEIVRVLPLTSGQTVEYKWRDVSLVEDGDYWYRVDRMDRRAIRSALTPPVRVSFTDQKRETIAD